MLKITAVFNWLDFIWMNLVLMAFVFFSYPPGSKHYPTVASFFLFVPRHFATADSGVPACFVDC